MSLFRRISARATTLAGAMGLALTAAAASGQVVNENGEAGDLLPTAQVINGYVTTINGKLANLGVSEALEAYVPDTDLYRITITNPAAFSARAKTHDAVYQGQDYLEADTQLALFDSAGLLVGFNDDLGGIIGSPSYVFDPVLAAGDFAGLAPGNYFLAINLFSRHPTFANGPFPYVPDGGIEGPLTGWDQLTPQVTTQYAIQLTGVGSPTPSVDTGVPEPAAWALMITGFGLAGARLRRRSAASA